jgi:hypothetical protein
VYGAVAQSGITDERYIVVLHRERKAAAAEKKDKRRAEKAAARAEAERADFDAARLPPTDENTPPGTSAISRYQPPHLHPKQPPHNPELQHAYLESHTENGTRIPATVPEDPASKPGIWDTRNPDSRQRNLSFCEWIEPDAPNAPAEVRRNGGGLPLPHPKPAPPDGTAHVGTAMTPNAARGHPYPHLPPPPADPRLYHQVIIIMIIIMIIIINMLMPVQQIVLLV